MTDQLDTLFRELAVDVEDDGFCDRVLDRIEGPRLIQRGLSATIYILMGVLIVGPLWDLMLLASANLSEVMSGWPEVAWATQSPTMLIAAVVAATVPAAMLALRD